jgi:predicted phage terminase large subunit-like protein
MADSAVVRQQTLQWTRESWSTRANTPNTVRIVVQQRVHSKDVAGYCIEEGGWDHLNLPCEYEGRKIITSIGWSDPRATDGELLWPSRYDTAEVASIKRTLGSAAYAGQFQQRPTARGGATFKKEWVRFWYDDAQGIPDPYVVQKSNGEMMECPQRPRPPIDEAGKLQSWDLSFKGGADNDYVVGQLWGTAKDARSHFYLLDQERGQMDFVATVAGIRRLQDRSPANATIVEDKANGAAVIASLKAEIPGLIPVNPQGGKESRASACAPLFEAGQVWLPHPGQYPWVEEFIEELCSFPRGAHDDQVDAMTQALARMREKRIDDIAEDAFMVDSHRRLSPWSGL